MGGWVITDCCRCLYGEQPDPRAGSGSLVNLVPVQFGVYQVGVPVKHRLNVRCSYLKQDYGLRRHREPGTQRRARARSARARV